MDKNMHFLPIWLPELWEDDAGEECAAGRIFDEEDIARFEPPSDWFIRRKQSRRFVLTGFYRTKWELRIRCVCQGRENVGREGFAIGVKSGGIASGFLEKVRLRRGDLGWESAGIRIEV